MNSECENNVDQLFLDFEKLVYQVRHSFRDEDMLDFADLLSQTADSFYAILFKKHLNAWLSEHSIKE